MIAHARYIRMSPRKLRLVGDLIRGMHVEAAETQLRFFRKAATVPMLKVLRSAIANAEDQYDGAREHLVIDHLMINAAPMLKRWRPRAFGRATPIRKRGAHITLVLKSTQELKRREKHVDLGAVATEKEQHHEAAVHSTAHGAPGHTDATIAHTGDIADARKIGSRHEPSRTKPVQKKSKGFLKKLFSRKTG
ncbi:50S ribosomal protein L22 [Candidatus Uhrbacteria bacterium]|nr:50S ribosomal protein L22 [Candidatus Uhrbacteria bacterium]